MIISCFLIGIYNVSAQTTVTLQPNLLVCVGGSNINVPIRVTGVGIYNMAFYLTYNPAKLTPVGFTAVAPGLFATWNAAFNPTTSAIFLDAVGISGGVNFTNEKVIEIIFSVVGVGNTSIHLRTAPDPAPVSGIWDPWGNPITPVTYTDIAVTVYPNFVVGSIAANQSICYNTVPAPLTGTAPTGGNTPYTYQWQSSIDNVIFTNITGATNLNYAPAALTATTYYRQVQSSASGCGTFNTNVVTITVYPLFVVGSIAADQSICYNTAPAPLTGTAPTGGSTPYTYQWQSSPNNVTFTDITGATNINYAPAALTTTTYYRLAQNSASGCSGNYNTNVLTITVYPNFVVGSIAANQSICYNTVPAPLTGTVPSGGNTPYTYQWQSSTNNVTFTNITGATNINYAPAALTVTTYYRQVQTSASGCGSLNTNVVTITVYSLPAVNPIANQVYCNSDISAITTPTGPLPGTTFSWTNSNNAIGLPSGGTGAIPGVIMSNPTNAPISAVINITPTANGCPGIPLSYTIVVNPTSTVNSIANQEYCHNAGAPLTPITGTVTGTTFTWTNSNPAIGLGASGSGNIPPFTATNPSASLINATITVIPSYSNNGIACPGSTKTFTITIKPAPVIFGSVSTCLNSTGNLYTTQSGMTKYTWTVSIGGIITAGGSKYDNFVEVSWTSSGAKSVSINYTDPNPNGCTAFTPTIFPVTVNPLPSPTIFTPSLMAESFENSGNIPAGWTIETLAPGNSLSFVTSSIFPSNYNAYNGSYFVRFDSYDNDNGIIRLKRTSPISTLGLNQVTLDFAWLESSAVSVANDRMDVEWSIDGITWNTCATFARYNPTQGWKVKNASLPVAALNQPLLFIAFKFISEYGMDCYLDYFHLTAGAIVSPGSSVEYATQPGMTNYDWTVSSGGTIISGLGTSSIVVYWNTLGNQEISVNFINPNGCSAAMPFILTITVVPQIPAQNTVSNVVVGNNQIKCYNASQTIIIAGNATTFFVQNGGSVTMIAGQNIKYLPATTVQSGGYMWGYIAPSGPWCQSPSMPAVAVVVDETPRSIVQTSFKVYPNPTTGKFILELNGESPFDKVLVDIYGVWGEKVMSTILNGNRKHEFSLSDRPAGVYFIRVVFGNKTETVKIIKQ